MPSLEGNKNTSTARANAPRDRGDGQSASESQRVVHTELPEQKTLFHLVVESWESRWASRSRS